MPEPKRLLPRAQRRAQIIQAAKRSFARNGFAATSMVDLADESGVTKMIIYRHFATKADLYRSVLDAISAELTAAVEAAGPWPGNISAIVEFAHRDPDGYALLFEHAAREPEFQDYTDAASASTLGTARAELDAFIADPKRREWAALLLPRLVTEVVLTWLDSGRPGDVASTTETVRSMTGAAVRAISGQEVG
ncbi:MAG TPA: TetR/AcrR family transcriptional regulator [Pseudonocardiaceae bacterium]|nr:TetR/AcrR family transcriptional regulator [Pseudonocardiaceae bacterium]